MKRKFSDLESVIDDMSVKELFKLRIAIRKEQYNRWKREIPDMIKTLPTCITSNFGIDEKWISESNDEWLKEQAFKNKSTWCELILFLALNPKNGFGDGQIGDDLWRIDINVNTEDGAEYYTPEGRKGGDKTVIDFKYLKNERYYKILTLYKLTETKWLLSHHIPSETKIDQELYYKLSLLFTDEVLTFWKNTFDRIVYGE